MTRTKIRNATMLVAMVVAVLVPSAALAQETPTGDDYPVDVDGEEVVDGDVAGESEERGDGDVAGDGQEPGDVAGDNEPQGAVAGDAETGALAATGATVTVLLAAAVLAIAIGAVLLRRRRTAA